ncbi:zinc ABC transporter substrate-binding protein [Sulfitobacter sabulilitoris]|uniref:High-affinity zinc uptake system protein ZnuA n=1 Tax=Sulfitobacter sabulilitoris TaxID=2562655 RepID=A0A5S3PIA0_9RHOB|nr:zinc ABC transporter substrate-binding protein [Sulfitobacter sabulilitoris]TMM54074.1 zinc transporter [Sulfitobacter sabulilitoris]
MLTRLFAFCLYVLALPAAATADAPRVATDIAPVHGLVAQVMAGVGTPDLVVPPGASPHGHAMRPSEARALSRADLVIWIGPALTPWLQGPIDTLAQGADRLTLLEAPGTILLPFREGAAFEADDHDHDHGHDETTHQEEASDPHAWLDPRNASVWLEAIAARLSALDPAHAATYRANAASAQADLDALEAEIAALLTPLQGRPFVVFHDAYHYFEARFGTEAVAALSLGDASDPGPAHLDEVRDAIARSGVTCAFVEPQVNTGLIDAVAEGQAVRIATLDPLGLDSPPGPGFYPALLRGMARAMADCLGG